MKLVRESRKVCLFETVSGVGWFSQLGLAREEGWTDFDSCSRDMFVISRLDIRCKQSQRV